ncbi:hypothetical protein [Flavobacterium sp.]|jgi:hypothetical protein|uniref:hypothetical protein n=1 Tax=Flavobacterium sp. TaxID=239 RepID=UPI0037BFBAC0
MLVKPIFPVIDYVVNYDYIAKVLCENKAKPELKCNGKCQLMKELAKAAEEEKPISPTKKNQTQEAEILFFQEIPALVAEQTSIVAKTVLNSHYSDLYFHLEGDTFFHPPTVIS